MLYTLHYITDLFHICKIQWNIIKDEMRWDERASRMLCVPQRNKRNEWWWKHVENLNALW